MQITALVSKSNGLYFDVSVTAGMGWSTNSTIFIVDDHVTWYAAAHLCKETYDADFKYKGRANYFVVRSLVNSTDLDDKLVWIGLIKSGHDDKLYFARNCAPVSFTHQLSADNRPGQTECILLNTTTTDNVYVYSDCQDIHPYLCIWRGDDITQFTYENVSVVVEESANLFKNEIGELTESQNCIKSCDSFTINCVAAIFEHSTNSCYIYNVDLFENFHTKYTFLVELSTNETTFYYKSWQRLHFAIKESHNSGNSTGYDGPSSFKCKYHM